MRGSETSGTPQAPGAAHKETHYLKLLMNHLFDLLSLNYALEQRTANSESSECAEQGPVLGDEPSLPMLRYDQEVIAAIAVHMIQWQTHGTSAPNLGTSADSNTKEAQVECVTALVGCFELPP